MKLAAPITPRLDEQKAEEARRVIVEKVIELQQLPFVGAQVIANVSLSDGVATPVAHKLGRRPLWFRESCVHGATTAGIVQQVKSTSHDPTKYIVLQADDFGATITCSVLIL